MRVGVPREIKPDEYRVALTPAGTGELAAAGHAVVVQAGAGEGSGFADDDYARHGTQIAPDAQSVFDDADLIVKVKEPQGAEVAMLRGGQALFTYLHLAPDAELLDGLIASGATCIAYETVRSADGSLPLLAPMSAIAGKLAAQAGAAMLSRQSGGRGVLLGGVPGVKPGKVMIIGGGVVGAAAAEVAIGLGAETYVFDLSIERLGELSRTFAGRCSTVYASTVSIEEMLPEADLVIGAVLVAGERAPRVITRPQLELMKRHAVIVDVSIDQGGCLETSRPTTHSAPTYEVDGILHYCVTNMPGVVPVTSTQALTNVTLPYILRLANAGLGPAVEADPALAAGVNVIAGQVTSESVARAHDREWTNVVQLLGYSPALS